MDYKVKVIQSGKSQNITAKVGNLTWSDSADALGAEFSFSFPSSYWDKNFKKKLSCGDHIVILAGSREIMRGIITQTPINGDEYKGYDYAFYLNKSECVIQYKKVAADKAIKQLCSRYEVPVGSISSMPTTIKKVYKDKTIYDVIKDILKEVKSETGQGHRLEMRNGKLYIVKSGSIKITPKYTDERGKKISCTKSASITGTRSIEELKNKVIVAGTGEDSTEIKSTAKSSKSIKKYGLLTAVETGDKLTSAKARNKAKNLLKGLNKVAVSFTAEMIGNNTVRSGRLLYFNRPEAGIKGWYKIKSVTHTVNAGKYLMSCEMERI